MKIRDLISRSIKLIMSQDIAIQAMVIAAVRIHFFHFSRFLLSDHDVKIKNQLYNR